MWPDLPGLMLDKLRNVVNFWPEDGQGTSGVFSCLNRWQLENNFIRTYNEGIKNQMSLKYALKWLIVMSYFGALKCDCK